MVSEVVVFFSRLGNNTRKKYWHKVKPWKLRLDMRISHHFELQETSRQVQCCGTIGHPERVWIS